MRTPTSAYRIDEQLTYWPEHSQKAPVDAIMAFARLLGALPETVSRIVAALHQLETDIQRVVWDCHVHRGVPARLSVSQWGTGTAVDFMC